MADQTDYTGWDSSPTQPGPLPGPLPGAGPSLLSPAPDSLLASAMQGKLLSHIFGENPLGSDPQASWAPSVKDLIQPSGNLSNALQQTGTAAGNLLMGPLETGGDALQKWMQGQQTNDVLHEITRATLGVAGLSAGAEAPTGSLRMFGGANSKTADWDAMAEAARLERNWETREDIWHQTGWFRGEDGNWKNEIPDTEARLKVGGDNGLGSIVGNKMTVRNSATKLSDVLEHPALYAAYPQLADASISPGPAHWMNSGIKGAVDSNGRIFLTPDSPEDMLSTLLHEVQHKVQGIEGFAPGGSSADFLPENFNEILSAAQNNLRPFQEHLRNNGIDPRMAGDASIDEAEGFAPYTPQHEEQLKAAKKLFTPEQFTDFTNAHREANFLVGQQLQAHHDYESLAGEVEARNVEARFAQDVGPETAPWKTTGYPPGKQIVLPPRPPATGYNLLPIDHDPFAGAPPQQ